MSSSPYNCGEYNIGNSIFPGLNDRDGVMLCGYEWGFSRKDQQLAEKHAEEMVCKRSQILTFAQKSSIYSSPYDLRIIRWFDYFGHSISRKGGVSVFDRCLLQTNWCLGADTSVRNFSKFLYPENQENFLRIVDAFRPGLLLFMGSRLIHCLQRKPVIDCFEGIFGKAEASPQFPQKPFDGVRFKIGFQRFERVQVVSLPHPSGSRGLSDRYIQLFASEMRDVFNRYKQSRGLVFD